MAAPQCGAPGGERLSVAAVLRRFLPVAGIQVEWCLNQIGKRSEKVIPDPGVSPVNRCRVCRPMAFDIKAHTTNDKLSDWPRRIPWQNIETGIQTETPRPVH